MLITISLKEPRMQKVLKDCVTTKCVVITCRNKIKKKTFSQVLIWIMFISNSEKSVDKMTKLSKVSIKINP